MIEECLYRPAYKWLWYLCEGWTVTPMQRHHERWILVSRRIA